MISSKQFFGKTFRKMPQSLFSVLPSSKHLGCFSSGQAGAFGEWFQIAERLQNEQRQELDRTLSSEQKERVDVICECFKELSSDELTLLLVNLQDHFSKMSGLDIMSLNMDWPSFKETRSSLSKKPKRLHRSK